MAKKTAKKLSKWARSTINRKNGVSKSSVGEQHCVAPKDDYGVSPSSGHVRTKAGKSQQKRPHNKSSSGAAGKLGPVTIGGAIIDQDRARWVELRQDIRSGLFPVSGFAGDGKAGLKQINDRGFLIFGTAPGRDLVQQIAEISSFRPKFVAKAPGYLGPHFVLQSGEAISPAGGPKPSIALPLINRTMVAGCVRDWRRIVRVFIGQPLPEFAICAAFAPLLLEILGVENFGVNFWGRSSSGKTTIGKVVASVWGPLDGSGSCFHTLNSTVNALEELTERHNDAMLVLDEAGFLGSGSRAKAAGDLYDFILRFSGGRARGKLGSKPCVEDAKRGVFIMTSNLSTSQMLSSRPVEEREAAAVRVIALEVPDGKMGVFASTPRGFKSTATAISQVRRELGANYGTPIRRFLKRLLRDRSADEAKLIADLEQRAEAFRRRVNADEATPQQLRVIERMTVVVLAGRLAQRYRVLPNSFDPEGSAAACYAMIDDEVKSAVAIVDRLKEWLRSNEYFDIRGGTPPRLSDEAFQSQGVFVANGVGKRTEVQMSEGVFRKIFPDFSFVLQSAEMQEVLICEKKRRSKSTYQNKRTVRQGHPNERVYVIEVPADIV